MNLNIPQISIITQEQWSTLSFKERLVVVAQDVLLRIELKQIVPKRGTYLAIKEELSTEVVISRELDARTFFLQEQCVGCARGALFLSKILLANSVTLGESVDIPNLAPFSEENDEGELEVYPAEIYVSGTHCRKGSLDFLDKNTEWFIEEAFEGRWSGLNTKDCLILLMKRIISNGGVFTQADLDSPPTRFQITRMDASYLLVSNTTGKVLESFTVEQ